MAYARINEVENKVILGRYIDEEKYPLPILFQGGGIELVVKGSELWVDLEATYETYDLWIALEINGEILSRLMLNGERQKICVFRNMNPEEEKHVRILRETQPMEEENTRLVIYGLDTDGSFLPVPRKKFTIEFIGDSITSGEGTYGSQKDMDWIPMFMSYTRDYAYMISNFLNANTYMISQGGWGVHCGWDNDIRHTIPAVYEKVCGFCTSEVSRQLGCQDDYDFGSRHVDAVVINLGTNDDGAFDQPAWTHPETGVVYQMKKDAQGDPCDEDLDLIKNDVKSFLETVRCCNPMAHIVWAYGMMGTRLSYIISQAVREYSEENYDENVAYLQLPDTDEKQFGSRNHPGVASHQASKEAIIAHLVKWFLAE